MANNAGSPVPISGKCKLWIACVAGATLIGGTIVGLWAGGIAVAAAVALGVFAIGILLWWHGDNTRRKWDEIGRAIMTSVLLAVVIGVPQYLIDQRQKDRDFKLSLTLQDDLSGADLAGKDLEGVRLQGKTLVGANLSHAELEKARLINTDFRGADLRGAHLRGADLRYTKLQNASLEGADLREAILKNANLSGATLAGAKLFKADLELSELKSACLADADLRRAKLAGANLDGAVLTSADVRGTVFESDLRPAKLATAGLAQADYNKKTKWPKRFKFRRAVEAEQVAHQPESPDRLQALFPAEVLKVADGDTVQLRPGSPAGHRHLPGPGRTRLIGVNAPDPDDPGGKAAKRYVKQQLSGEKVLVKVGAEPVDDGGRYLVYILLSDGKTLNEELLESGHASLNLDQNQSLADQLRTAELEAKQEGRGLWRNCPQPFD